MLTDIMIYIMPMPVIWRLQMTSKRKFELTLVFAVGGLYLHLILGGTFESRKADTGAEFV